MEYEGTHALTETAGPDEAQLEVVLGQLNQEQQSVPVPFLAALPLRSHAQVGDSTPACLTLQALEGGSSKVLC